MPRGIYPPIPTLFQNGEVAYDKPASNLQKWALDTKQRRCRWAEVRKVSLEFTFEAKTVHFSGIKSSLFKNW